MCLRPITLRVPDKVPHSASVELTKCHDDKRRYVSGSVIGRRYVQVPCGHCIECLHEKQNVNAMKIYYELLSYSKACFLTLTYRPSTVPQADGIDPETGECCHALTLRKSDVQGWLKRIRIEMQRRNGQNIRVSYCGEYGTKTYRPHYHVLIYGYNVEELQFAISDWIKRFGLVNAQNVRYFPDKEHNDDSYHDSLKRVARYVSKYASKGVFGETMPIFRHNYKVLVNGKEEFRSDETYLSREKLLQKPFFRNSNYLGLNGVIGLFPYFDCSDTDLTFESLTDFCDYLKYRQRVEFSKPKYIPTQGKPLGQVIPLLWRDLLWFKRIPSRRSLKQLSPEVNHFFNKTIYERIQKFLSHVPSMAYLAKEDGDLSVFRIALEDALFACRCRLFERRLYNSACVKSEAELHELSFNPYRKLLEEEQGAKQSLADTLARQLQNFYAKSKVEWTQADARSLCMAF